MSYFYRLWDTSLPGLHHEAGEIRFPVVGGRFIINELKAGTAFREKMINIG
jgi:hypothetical protein